MDYKVLVKIFVPELEMEYELYIPINRNFKKIKVNINRMINDDSEGIFPIKNNLEIFNRRTGKQYVNKDIVRKTDIRNGTELVLI